MYLGEIVRRVLLKMGEEGGLFGKSFPNELSSPFILKTPDLCSMQKDTSNDLQTVGSVLYEVAKVSSLTLYIGYESKFLSLTDLVI